MKINLRKELDDEIEFFVQKFIKLGWKQEDISYLTKDVGFLTHPHPNEIPNKKARTSVSVVLYPELLEYSNNYYSDKSKMVYTTTPWIAGSILISEDKNFDNQRDSEIFKNIAKFMREEIPKTGFKPFYDEDAFYGTFSIPRIDYEPYYKMKFFLNKDYPDGWWQNHAIQ